MIAEYTILFFFYSFLGAVLEHISYYGSDTKKELSNPIITGFPLYGFGALLIIFINEKLKVMGWENNLLIQFMFFGIALSVLEYIVGVYVGAGKDSYQNGRVNAWDYSGEFMNIDGKISLRHFISWGILGIILVRLNNYLIKKVTCMVNCKV